MDREAFDLHGLADYLNNDPGPTTLASFAAAVCGAFPFVRWARWTLSDAEGVVLADVKAEGAAAFLPGVIPATPFPAGGWAGADGRVGPLYVDVARTSAGWEASFGLDPAHRAVEVRATKLRDVIEQLGAIASAAATFACIAPPAAERRPALAAITIARSVDPAPVVLAKRDTARGPRWSATLAGGYTHDFDIATHGTCPLEVYALACDHRAAMWLGSARIEGGVL